MKKLVLLLAVLPILFSCGDDDKENEELYYLQVVTKYDLGDDAPEGYIHIFYLDNTFPSELKPHFIGGDVCYMKDVNNEYIHPVYSKKLTKDKELTTGLYKNTSTHSVLPSNLSSLYGTPDPKGKYLIAIGVFRPTDPSESGYSYTWKESNFMGTKLNKIFKLHPSKANISIMGVYNDPW